MYLESLPVFIMLTIHYGQKKNSFLSSKATSDDSFQKPEPNPSSREQILLWRKWRLKTFYFCHRKFISQKLQT